MPIAIALAAVQTRASPQLVSSDSGLTGGSSDFTTRQPAVRERSISMLASIAAPAPTIIQAIWSFWLRALRFGLLVLFFFIGRCYRCAYALVRPARSKGRTSYLH